VTQFATTVSSTKNATKIIRTSSLNGKKPSMPRLPDYATADSKYDAKPKQMITVQQIQLY
jgi:hypothetical protein